MPLNQELLQNGLPFGTLYFFVCLQESARQTLTDNDVGRLHLPAQLPHQPLPSAAGKHTPSGPETHASQFPSLRVSALHSYWWTTVSRLTARTFQARVNCASTAPTPRTLWPPMRHAQILDNTLSSKSSSPLGTPFLVITAVTLSAPLGATSVSRRQETMAPGRPSPSHHQSLQHQQKPQHRLQSQRTWQMVL